MGRQQETPGQPCFAGAIGGQKRMVGGRRFDRPNVQAGAGDVVVPKRHVQRVDIDDRAARGVNQNRARFHRLENRLIDQFGGGRVKRRVDTKAIGHLGQVGQTRHPPETGGQIHPVGQVGIIESHLHIEPGGATGRRQSDTAEADHAKNAAAQAVDAGIFGVAPSSRRIRPHGAMVKAKTAAQGEHQGKRVIGHLGGAVIRHSAYRDAALTERLQVQTVETDPAAHNHAGALQFGQGGHHHRRAAVGDNPVGGGPSVIGDRLGSVEKHHLDPVAGGGDLNFLGVGGVAVGNQNFHNPFPSLCRSMAVQRTRSPAIWTRRITRRWS